MSLESKIQDDYFEWLYNTVCQGRVHDEVSFRKIFTLLHQIEFTFIIPNDINRAKDGVNLRYRYSLDMDDPYINEVLDGPSSVLEMMVALAIKCEEQIMSDTRYGDRTAQWFWCMMSNLGIGNLEDSVFDEEYTYAVETIGCFLDRGYRPDGKGGLFYIRGCEYNLCNEEIWTQLLWYLDKFA